MAAQIHCQSVDGLIAAASVLLQAFHHNPVKVALNLAMKSGGVLVAIGRDRGERGGVESRAGFFGFLLTNDSQRFIKRNSSQLRLIKRRCAREQFVEQYTER